ncbi:NUDIX hydrolase [Azospirillum lipoferum]|uniref:NTP pyrophosphohydrolase n=1 Tax=Azospirillum lipoferum (strain 4B) TaxID=862719 RepID=G7ZIJ9_AZOL4|nr:NUDIX hydrolase [Azospirillum lipoferum]CBS91439.1 putative NTP pyrophosphohydrolase [Azospirillum lipoferum 4B]
MPPILTSRRLVYANSKWRAYADDLRGDGTTVDGYLVVEPMHAGPDMVTGVAVLGETDGRFALLHNHRHPLGQRSWEMVKGFIDAGENPADAARRELTEETGLACDPEDLVPLGSFTPEGATMAARGLLFLARRCRPSGRPDTAAAISGTVPDGSGPDEIEIGLGATTLFDLETVERMAGNSEIEDAATLIGIYRALAWLKRECRETTPNTSS